MIHKKMATRKSWYFQSKEGWSIGTALDHYRYEHVIPRDTKAVTISDMVDFLHQYITAPTVTPDDHILHTINTLTGAIKETPITVYDAQLKGIKALQDACHWWAFPGTPENHPNPITPQKTFPLYQSPRVLNPPVPPTLPLPPPRVQMLPVHHQPSPRLDPPIVNPAPPPRVPPKTKRPIVHEPVTKRTRLNTAPIYNPIALCTHAKTKKALTVTPAQAARCYYPQALLALWCTPIQEMAMTVLDVEKGKHWNIDSYVSIPNIKTFGRNCIVMN